MNEFPVLLNDKVEDFEVQYGEGDDYSYAQEEETSLQNMTTINNFLQRGEYILC